MSMMARSLWAPLDEAEDTSAVRSRAADPRCPATALRARPGPSAAGGGALRVALTRARAAASVHARGDEGDAFVAVNEGTALNAGAFSLTEESR